MYVYGIDNLLVKKTSIFAMKGGWAVCTECASRVEVRVHGLEANGQDQSAPIPVTSDVSLALMRYWARLMLAGVPVMVIWRSDDPSVALAILI